jgi:hypothetical protein
MKNVWRNILLLPLVTGGCLIDDSGGNRGQTSTPSATVPDTGGPARRESPTKTLNDAKQSAKPSDGTLDVQTGEQKQ